MAAAGDGNSPAAIASALETHADAVTAAFAKRFWEKAHATPTPAVVVAPAAPPAETPAAARGPAPAVATTVTTPAAAQPPTPLDTAVEALRALLALLPTIDLEPFAYLQAHLPALMDSSPDIHSAVLALAGDPRMKRRAGDGVDMLAMIVRAIPEVIGVIDDDDDDSALMAAMAAVRAGAAPAKTVATAAAEVKAKTAADTPTTGLTPALTARATEICRSGAVTPKVFEALHQVYKVTLSEDELLAYGRQLIAAQLPREAADFVTRFKLQAKFTHEELLLPLIKKKFVDTYCRYVEFSKDVTAANYVITHVAERGEGEDPNLAIKLIPRFGLRSLDFPRVLYLKKKDCIWWAVRAGKHDEFVSFLCADSGDFDRPLQIYLCKQLSKCRVPSDPVDCLRYMKLYGVEGEDECKAMAVTCEAKLKELAAAAAAEEAAAKALAEGKVPEGAVAEGKDGEKKKRAKVAARQREEAEDEAESAGLEALTIDVSQVVFVSDSASLAIASAALLDHSLDAIGIDLEHMPENFAGVHTLPCTCQLLQIATRTRVFLFDLQSLVTAAPATPAAAVATAPAGGSSPAKSPSSAGAAAAAPAMSPYKRAFDDLITAVFDSERLMKIGMGFEADWAKMRGEFAEMVCFQVPINCYYDLKQLTEDFPPALVHPALSGDAAAGAPLAIAVPPPQPSPTAGTSSGGGVRRSGRSGTTPTTRSPAISPQAEPRDPPPIGGTGGDGRRRRSRGGSRDDASPSAAGAASNIPPPISTDGGGGGGGKGGRRNSRGAASPASPPSPIPSPSPSPPPAGSDDGKSGELPKSAKERHCYACGGMGHYSNSPQCPKKKEERAERAAAAAAGGTSPSSGAGGKRNKGSRSNSVDGDGSDGGGGRRSRRGSGASQKESPRSGGSTGGGDGKRPGSAGKGGRKGSDPSARESKKGGRGGGGDIEDIYEEPEAGQEKLLRKRWVRDVGGAKKKEGGLARLVRLVLARRLDKSQQISHWGRRPLTCAQLAYAAVDAQCQIAIVDRMRAVKLRVKGVTITQ